MATDHAQSQDKVTTLGALKYLQASVQSSLYRNGKVLTRRDADGSDAGMEGVLLESREMTIQDARRLQGSERRSLSQNGFELVNWNSARSRIDFLDHDQVLQQDYPR
jgi:hypothetical protein